MKSITCIVVFHRCYKMQEAEHNPGYRDAKQGGKILLFKNFEYNKHQKDGKRIHYRCRDRSKYQCKVSLAVDVESGKVLRVSGEHRHDSDILHKNVKAAEKEAIRNI